MIKIVFFIYVLGCCHGSFDIGKFLKVCERNSPDVNDCLVDAVQDGLVALAGGIPDIGVPSVDPYHQKELRIDYKRNQIMVKANFKDIYVSGLKEAKVRDVRLKADDDRFHLEIDLSTPQIYVNGYYNGEGRYNALRINASGEFNATMTDLVWTWKLDGTPEKIDDEIFMRIESFYMRPDIGNMKTYVSNDNLESKELTELGNRFANENWRALYRELLPFAQANWNKIGIRVANKLFLKIPYNQLFPAQL